ncbi:MAG: RDD family protein [Bdellovibrionales bacterium]|nr:RDD family protein [Bdellovibrionales bacterium]
MSVVHKSVYIRRFGAGIIDGMIEVAGGLLGSYFGAMVAALVVALKNESPTAMQSSIWNGVGFGFVFWMFSISFLNRVLIQGVSRASIGKKVFDIELVSAVGPLTWGSVIKRWLLGYVSLFACGAGFIYSLFNKEGHTFHDVITGTDVIPVFKSATMEMEHVESLVGEPRVPNMARITSLSFVLSNVQSERPESNVIQLPVKSKDDKKAA